METPIGKDLLTRSSEMPLRVINSAKNSEVVTTIKRIRRSYRQIRTENVFKKTLVIMALAMVVLVFGIMLTLIIESIPSIKALGFKYLWGKTWDPVQDIYGAYPFLLGTLLSSFLALVISVPS